MSFVFSTMTPLSSLTKYNLGLLDVVDDEKKLLNFLRMEKWLADRPHHPGEAAKQWLKDLYQQNKLVKNQFELGGRKVELAKITMPVLNVYAKEDHIIPPQCSRALAECVGTDDYSEIGLAGGHVGVFVSGKSQGVLGKGIVDWLKERPVTLSVLDVRAAAGWYRELPARHSPCIAVAPLSPALRGVPCPGPARLHADGLHGMGTRRCRANGGLRARAHAQQPRLRFSRPTTCRARMQSRGARPSRTRAQCTGRARRGLRHSALSRGRWVRLSRTSA